MRRRPADVEPLPIQALYCVGQLARAMGISYRSMQSLLKSEEVSVLRAGRLYLVPLTEIEEKLPVVWESVKAAAVLRSAVDDP